jgi:catechol 2,3-dioxygenase-like lactoylglutathione lyase family enzyme
VTMLTLIDHVAITVADVEATTAFYDALFGAERLRDVAPEGRLLVRLLRIGGGVQLSVHHAGNGLDLVAASPMPGSADICFRFCGSVDAALALLDRHGIACIDGPSPRTTNAGAPAQSVYFRDPDGNLLELMMES